MNKSSLLKSLLIVPVIAVGLVSCLKKIDKVDGHIMVVNASPGFGPFDIFLDNNKLNSSPVGYAGTTSYYTTQLGDHVLKTTAAGGSNVLTEGNLNVVGNIHQSLFFYGPSTALQGVVVDDSDRKPDSAKAFIRFFNLSSGSGVVDFGFEDGANFNELFPDRNYETSDSMIRHAGFINITPGTYELKALSSTTGATLNSLPNFQILVGKTYTVYLGGTAGGSPPPALQVITHSFIP